jgi:hypothetical protein
MVDAVRVVDAGKNTPVIAVIGDMKIASVGLAVIMHNVTAHVVHSACSKLIFDMLGDLYYVFGNFLRLGKNKVIDALEDIFPLAVFDKRLGKIGIVYISSADAIDLVDSALQPKFLYYLFKQ